MRFALRLVVALVVTMGLLTGTASAQFSDPQDRISKMDKLFDDPWAATHSDFAFWGNYAVWGGTPRRPAACTSTTSRIRPARTRSGTSRATGTRTTRSSGTGTATGWRICCCWRLTGPWTARPATPRSVDAGGQTVRFDANPNGWEGVRVFEVSDGSGDYEAGAPFAVINQVDAQYTDCGAHTITANTKFADDPANPRLVVYVPSYPLRPGPTCGQTGSTAVPPYQNVNNPFERRQGRVNDPLHRLIQVLNVPLNNPANTTEIAQPEISYQIPGWPRDPDGRQDWSEKRPDRARAGGGRVPRHRHPRARQHPRRGLRRAGPDLGGRSRHPDPGHAASDGGRRRRAQLGRQGPVPRRRRLLPLGDVRQRHGDRELGGRVVRQRLPDDDRVAGACLASRRDAQDRQHVLLRHGGELPEPVPRR